MKDDFLSFVTGSQVRARLLRVFVLNPSEFMSLEHLSKRSGVPIKSVHREVELFEKGGIVKKSKHVCSTPVEEEGKKSKKPKKHVEVVWQFNALHEYARALSFFVQEVSPLKPECIVDALKKSGKITTIILSGSFMGDSSRPADLVVAADSFDERRIEQAVRSLEPLCGREIRYAAFSTLEFRYRMTVQDRLIRDTLDYPHEIIFDKGKVI